MPADEGTQSYYAHYKQVHIPDWVKIVFWIGIGTLVLLML